jgi:hypothetical protein
LRFRLNLVVYDKVKLKLVDLVVFWVRELYGWVMEVVFRELYQVWVRRAEVYNWFIGW